MPDGEEEPALPEVTKGDSYVSNDNNAPGFANDDHVEDDIVEVPGFANDDHVEDDIVEVLGARGLANKTAVRTTTIL